VRNLYGATKDLRSVLAAVPGMRLQVLEGSYSLIFASEIALR
jgi:hypothetical protein